MTEKTIYQIIKEINKKEIPLLEFKEFYSPVELSSQLTHLVNTGICKINWKDKILERLDVSESNLVSKRNKKDNIRKVPENLKTEKIEPNKPKLY